MGYRMQDIPKNERPRERMTAHGPQVLSDAELLAVILGTGTRGFPVMDVARELLRDGWGGLARKRRQELANVRGLGPAKTLLLTATIEMAQRLKMGPERAQISSPHDAIRLVSDMKYLDQEELRVVFLNTKNYVLAIETVFRGGLDSVEVYPREIFRRAVAYSAAAIIVIHNHPSGDSTPSQDDRLLTKRLVQAGAIMGVPVLDHIVIGILTHTSIEHGIISD